MPNKPEIYSVSPVIKTNNNEVSSIIIKGRNLNNITDGVEAELSVLISDLEFDFELIGNAEEVVPNSAIRVNIQSGFPIDEDELPPSVNQLIIKLTNPDGSKSKSFNVYTIPDEGD